MPESDETLDLRSAIAETFTLHPERGGPKSVLQVLETLGVSLPLSPSMDEVPSRSGAPGEEPPERGPERAPLSLGRFQVVGELGRGGMGRVLEARDPDLRRAVAVKVIIDPRRVTLSQLARFVAEAQIASQLEHPNIVPVYEMGIAESGDLFFVMRKVEGRSLRQVIQRLRRGDDIDVWPRNRLLRDFVQVCNALAYAHDRGVLHRDLKPDNVMLGSFGQVLLMDWGVARVLGTQEHLAVWAAIDRLTMGKTMDGATIGTPGYMSPEQAEGSTAQLDARSDVWSLGAILYEILTLTQAYSAPNLFALLHLALTTSPQDPRERAPDRRIPDEIAEVCMRAMAARKQDRYPSALELAAAVQAHLDGTRRREAALGHVAAAERAWQDYRDLAAERDALSARLRELEDTVPTWAPLEEKAELLSVRRDLDVLRSRRVRTFGGVLAACDRALAEDADCAEARRLLARVHYARFEEAEAARDDDERIHHEQRVRALDDGTWAPILRGTGSLSLRTDPPGAEVVCQRYDTEAGLVWPLVERRALGVTPLRDVSLAAGSYLLTLRSPGCRDTRYPVHIPRGHRWDSGERPVPLLSDGQIGPDCVYVPAGPCIVGGDPAASGSLQRTEAWVTGFLLATYPVTMQDYAGFLDAVARHRPEAAWARVPRHQSGATNEAGRYWARPAPGEPYRVPKVDGDGDPWDPRWPASSISWDDALAYAAWRGKQDQLHWTLPLDLQWEKAARGADGRFYPWGDSFDAALCKMRESRPGRPTPEPIGGFVTDASPYGALGMAGGIRDWCGDEAFDGDPEWRPVRGGSWISGAPACRSARRRSNMPSDVSTNRGFRLARPLPTQGGDHPTQS